MPTTAAASDAPRALQLSLLPTLVITGHHLSAVSLAPAVSPAGRPLPILRTEGGTGEVTYMAGSISSNLARLARCPAHMSNAWGVDHSKPRLAQLFVLSGRDPIQRLPSQGGHTGRALSRQVSTEQNRTRRTGQDKTGIGMGIGWMRHDGTDAIAR